MNFSTTDGREGRVAVGQCAAVLGVSPCLCARSCPVWVGAVVLLPAAVGPSAPTRQAKRLSPPAISPGRSLRSAMPPYRGLRALVARCSCSYPSPGLDGLGYPRPEQAPRHQVEAIHGPLGTSTWCGSHHGRLPLLAAVPSLLLLLLVLGPGSFSLDPLPREHVAPRLAWVVPLNAQRQSLLLARRMLPPLALLLCCCSCLQ